MVPSQDLILQPVNRKSNVPPIAYPCHQCIFICCWSQLQLILMFELYVQFWWDSMHICKMMVHTRCSGELASHASGLSTVTQFVHIGFIFSNWFYSYSEVKASGDSDWVHDFSPQACSAMEGTIQTKFGTRVA